MLREQIILETLLIRQRHVPYMLELFRLYMYTKQHMESKETLTVSPFPQGTMCQLRNAIIYLYKMKPIEYTSI